MNAQLTSRAFVLLIAVAAASCDDPTKRIAGFLSGPEAAPDTTTAAPAADGPTVVLTATSAKPLQGFTLRVEYLVAKGSFAGTADGVACTSAAPGFTPNDRDDGTMLLVTGSLRPLTFPVVVRCRFDARPDAALAAGDVAVVVQSVTVGGAPGDAGDLDVTVTID